MRDPGNIRQTPAAVFFIIIFTVIMALTFTAVRLYQKMNRDAILSASMISAVNQVETQKRLIQSSFRTIKSDLMFLPHLNEILRYKEINTEEDRTLIENEFLNFITFSDLYDQVRYIDKSGMEIIRVDYNNGNPSLIPQQSLQNKRDRYYFKETISIPENRIYISPFDLNVENGKIEEPSKPMIRFGTPVFNNRGEVTGILILNFLGQSLLNELSEATNSQPGYFELMNQEGFWLHTKEPEQEWGFMYPGGEDLNMTSRSPAIWKRITSSEQSQFIINETLYTAELIKPLNGDNNITNNREYILLNTIPFEEMKIDTRSQNRFLLSTLGIVFIFAALLSLFFSLIIVQRNKYRSELKESALYDQLTGLPNRTLLEERAAQVSAHAKRYRNVYAVMFIDIDGFKPVNDKYGHKTGDELLKRVGDLLLKCIRETDTAARFGGDEFVILLSQINEKLDCSSVARKILARLFNEFEINENKIRIGASIGIASVSPDSDVSFQQAMQTADTAMYDVKKSGKNNYKVVTV